MNGLTWTILAMSIGMFGDIMLKRGGIRGLFVGLFVFAVTSYPTWKAYQHSSFSSITVIWQATYLVLGLTIGVFFFGDSLSLKKIVAIGFALIAVFLAD